MSAQNDLGSVLKLTAGWAGATISTATDTDSAIIIDTKGYESLVFAVYSGTITDGAYALKIQVGDAANLSDAADVAAYTVQDAFAATEDDTVQKVGCRTVKRYARLRITSTGTTSGGVFKGAVAILGSPQYAPVA